MIRHLYKSGVFVQLLIASGKILKGHNQVDMRENKPGLCFLTVTDENCRWTKQYKIFKITSN
jgi:hypothetical protein